MGRAKLRMELIKNLKARQTTFRKRKSGLKKKTYELSTLCAVKVCVMIYNRDEDEHMIRPDFWPENVDVIKDLIKKFKGQPACDRKKRSHDLSDFFDDQRKKAEHELTRTRKTSTELRYPTWDNSYGNFSEEQLREFGSFLASKLQPAKARLNDYIMWEASSRMKDPQIYPTENHHSYFVQDFSRGRNMEFELLHQQSTPQIKLGVDQAMQELHRETSLVSNPFMMMLMGDNFYCGSEFGGGGTSSSDAGYVPNPGLNDQAYYDPLDGTLQSVMMKNRMQSAMCYYSERMHPVPKCEQFHPTNADISANQIHASRADGQSGYKIEFNEILK